MTLRELSQLHHLTREVEEMQEHLRQIEEQAEAAPCADLSGMPTAHGDGSRVEANAIAIAEYKAMLGKAIGEMLEERNRLEAYILTIPDSLTRRIFTLRFVDGLTWEAVAERVYLTERGVWARVYKWVDPPGSE